MGAACPLSQLAVDASTESEPDTEQDGGPRAPSLGMRTMRRAAVYPGTDLLEEVPSLHRQGADADRGIGLDCSSLPSARLGRSPPAYPLMRREASQFSHLSISHFSGEKPASSASEVGRGNCMLKPPCTIRTTPGSGSSTMPKRRPWEKTYITWKRLTRLYLAQWWRAAMVILLAALARRRLR